MTKTRDPGMKHYETATFAAGCFWGVEDDFGTLEGVIKTRVGYTGGHTQKPTYQDVCGKNTGHAEAVEVTFDPQVVSYQDLLRLFFSIHNAGSVVMQCSDNSSQYRSAIFYHNETQRMLAQDFIRNLEASRKHGPKIHTQLAPASTFWEAEAYHQKYNQKHGRVC